VRRSNKAQIRVTEAFLSTFIIFSALAICSVLSPLSNSSGSQNTLAVRGMQALVQLDSDGTLGRMIEQGNWTALSDVLRLSLPIGVAYNLTVYDENMQQVNSAPISNGNLVGDVVAVEYLCASQSIQYHSYKLRLQLAVVK
jgi:hypothetical protein